VSVLGAGVGAAVALGVWAVLAGLAARRPQTASDRIAPYLEPSGVSQRRRESTTWERLVGPSVRDVVDRLQAASGGSARLEARLIAAGRDGATPGSWRLEQLAWSLGGLLLAVATVLVLDASGRPVRLPVVGVLLVTGTIVGALACDRSLTRAVERRQESIRASLPVVADLLSLAVSSGESPVAALERVARTARGPLAQECARACAAAASGVAFVVALDAMAHRVDVPSVRRFVDGIVIAVHRGTPLSDVLRAQAGDARAELYRALVESASRKELLMLVPVVFLVLPTVVLVALYPALTSLTALSP
jgi:tight adherence protein C